MVLVTIHIVVVTISIVTTTILVFLRYFNKTIVEDQV